MFVRQPNSPKKRNYWTEFSKSANGDIFRVLAYDEMSCLERVEEDRLLQL